MKTNILVPEFRKKLKELLQGFAEHCEISDRLAGRIEHPVYFHGLKFGSPVFTFEGPELDGGPKRVTGLLAHNTKASSLASEIVLQLIEVATLRPELAAGRTLRVLPVSDPVTLELGEDAPDLSDWPVLSYVADEFRHQATDGLIEILPSSARTLVLRGFVDPGMYRVLASSVVERRGLPSLPVLEAAAGNRPGDWHLVVEVPASWTHSGDVLAVSRFIGRLLEAHAHLAGSHLRGRGEA